MEPRDASDIDGQNREVEWHAVLAGIFSRGKTGRSSRDSMYCPANCRALSQQWKLSTICDSTHVRLKLARVPLSLVATLATLPSISKIPFLDCSFAITSPEWSEWGERHRRQSDEGRSE